ncbi:MAG: hypothetical protein B5M56_08955 [Desulfococcus sp. 4484_241]|nr:MAG: hypothetical protein B5M56_08955 [Desulfococcus sp. 4484_241]
MVFDKVVLEATAGKKIPTLCSREDKNSVKSSLVAGAYKGMPQGKGPLQGAASPPERNCGLLNMSWQTSGLFSRTPANNDSIWRLTFNHTAPA